MNSRDKGKRGELEFAAVLREHGVEARRGVQHAGGPDSPDVIHDIPGLHFEVKRVERVQLYEWIAQAERDAGDRVPVVVTRRNRDRRWYAILPLEALLPLALGLGYPHGEPIEPDYTIIADYTIIDGESY